MQKNTIHFLSFQAISADGLTILPENSQEFSPKIDFKDKAYLIETDWYIIRKIETNEDIPADVLSKRAQARETLNG